MTTIGEFSQHLKDHGVLSVTRSEANMCPTCRTFVAKLAQEGTPYKFVVRDTSPRIQRKPM